MSKSVTTFADAWVGGRGRWSYRISRPCLHANGIPT